jgi:hypothetical protein
MLAFLIALFAGCKKDAPAAKQTPVPDTIKPLSYYPIYPGSWWKYLQNDTGIVLSKASVTYQANSFMELSSGGNVASPVCMVPYLDGQPIYGYQEIAFIPPPFGGYYTKWPILSETIGAQFSKYWVDPRTQSVSEQITVMSKTRVGSDSILTLKGSLNNPPYNTQKTYYLYQKGVGLINTYTIDTVSHDTLSSLRLLSYYIGH